jgi:hypothetical protein
MRIKGTKDQVTSAPRRAMEKSPADLPTIRSYPRPSGDLRMGLDPACVEDRPTYESVVLVNADEPW